MMARGQVGLVPASLVAVLARVQPMVVALASLAPGRHWEAGRGRPPVAIPGDSWARVGAGDPVAWA